MPRLGVRLGWLCALCTAIIVSVPGPVAAASPLSALPPRACVVGTFNGRSLTLYANGKQAAHGLAPGPIDASQEPFEIGAYAGGAVWSGTIGEVAVYDRVLLAA